MDIKKHPVWNNISLIKKPAHLTRIFLAQNFAKMYPRQAFIGITGSVGKTTTSLACQSVLAEKFSTISTTQNLDPILNIPITILKMRPGIKKVILEMGVEYPEEMDFYLSLAKPATAVITRISFSHTQFLGGIEGVYHEKSKLVKQLPKNGFAILNWDDIYTRKLAKETEAEVVFYGSDPKQCSVWASNIRLQDNKTTFELNYGVERVEVTFNLLGRHMVSAALAAAALGITCGITLTGIKKGLEKVLSAPHRLHLLEGLKGFYVLEDTYNSSPVALEEALNVLNELPARRRIAALGEMRELGIYSEQLHRSVAQKIYKDKIDYVLLGSGDTKFIADELLKLGYLPERLESNLSNTQLVSTIIKLSGSGDVVLVKGSRALRMDEVVGRITKPVKG